MNYHYHYDPMKDPQRREPLRMRPMTKENCTETISGLWRTQQLRLQGAMRSTTIKDAEEDDDYV